jgi:hypothetical protein
MQAFTSEVWYNYLTPWQKELVDTSAQLLELMRTAAPLPDYGFVVFPMAKAYEGFLKNFFLNLGLINPDLFTSRRFRIGRAFNPDLSNGQRNEFWIYDDVARVCGEEIARQLWEAWLTGRNQVFHYFPDEKGKLTLAEAESKLVSITQAMAAATSSPAAQRYNHGS